MEEGICQKIEEAVRSIDGIKKMTSVAKEGSGSVVLELRADIQDVEKVVTEVRSEVDRIPSFPELAEDPEVQQITMRYPVIKVGVLAPPDRPDFDELELRAITERVRDDLLQLKTVTQVNVQGSHDYQIDIEIDEDTLRKYGLSLQQVADIVRRENLEMPGGILRSRGEEVLLRGKNKWLTGTEIAQLPLVTDPGGVVLTVGDLGTVRDEFIDTTAICEIDQRPGLVLSVDRTTSEDILAMTAEVRAYVAAAHMPGGYQLVTWGDRSVDVRDRLEMLIQNGIMGLILVFLVLAVFLELRLAFWVSLGIPVAMLGAGVGLFATGQTLNMLSMFAFLMALGIIVDDAIVVGENVYAHRQMGKGYIQAAVDGTVEVIPSVIASVTTTIIAFCPMLFVAGIMGKFIAVMPFAVIAMLVISLLESTFILPCHLAHRDNLVFRILGFVLAPFHFLVRLFNVVNRWSTAVLERLINQSYVPSLRWSLQNPLTVIASAVAGLLITVGIIRGGFVPYIIFPKLDSNNLEVKLAFPDGTPADATDRATLQIADALWRVNETYQARGGPVVRLIQRSVGQQLGSADPVRGGLGSGSHVGSLDVELVDTSQRNVTSQKILAEWRQEVGEIPGVESIIFDAPHFGPAGTPIEFKALAPAEQVAELEEFVEQCKTKLATYPGVFDVRDDSKPGKWELRIRVKERAKAMGISTADLAETIRGAYYGVEVMRLQRDRHEVKLMVRYPPEDRRSLADFRDIRIRANDGEERPVTELAEIEVQRGYSEINRVDQMRSITISADVDESQGNASEVVASLQRDFVPTLLSEHPGVRVRWEGQKEQTRESLGSLLVGSAIALVAMFFLLVLEFRSYLQPLLVMIIIPFGLIGAVIGHWVMGLPVTLFSFFGLVALTGVVVNDSIVLIDFINRRVRGGMPIQEALVDAGRRRFRPVLLTSLTTIAGLLPILVETSFQAQILIPMATSLAFGLALATALVLILVPVFYRVYYSAVPYQPPGEEDRDTRPAGPSRPAARGGPLAAERESLEYST